MSSERGTRKYTFDEIKEMTDGFFERRVVGKGGYGKVYKGILDHTPIAIYGAAAGCNRQERGIPERGVFHFTFDFLPTCKLLREVYSLLS